MLLAPPPPSVADQVRVRVRVKVKLLAPPPPSVADQVIDSTVSTCITHIYGHTSILLSTSVLSGEASMWAAYSAIHNSNTTVSSCRSGSLCSISHG